MDDSRPSADPRAGAGPKPLWQRVLTGLAALGDGLVFLPVALTWFEIARAFEHFGKIEGEREDFLTEWQGGFRGAGPTISSVATRIAAMVVAVAVLYTVLSFLERRGSVEVAVATSREDPGSAEYAREVRSVLERIPTLVSSYAASDMAMPAPAVGGDGDGTRAAELVAARGALQSLAASAKEQADVLKEIRELLIDAQIAREGTT